MVASALMLTGCVSATDRNVAARPGESFASHILRAADYDGIYDAPGFGASAADGMNQGLIGASDIRDIGHFLLTGSFLGLLASPEDKPAGKSAIIAFAPKDFAASEEEARQKFWGIATEAIRKAAEIRAPGGVVETDSGEVEMLFSSRTYRGIDITWTEEGCAEMRGSHCRFAMGTTDQSQPVLEPRPAILDGGEGWIFRRNRGLLWFLPVAVDDSTFSRVHSEMDDIFLYQEASKYLPDWAFIYVAPLRAGFFDPQTQDLRLFPAPVVFDQGKAHFFIEGATRDQPGVISKK